MNRGSCNFIRQFSLSCINQVKSHYEILGLPRTVSSKKIKSRFYELSKKYHPDRTRSMNSEDQNAANLKYQNIKNAYEILSDKQKKRQYDMELSQSSNVYHDQSRNARSAQTGSGLNRMRSRVYNYGKNYNSNPDHPLHGRYTGGSNYDVPHFDFDKHYQQQSGYEKHRRRMDHLKYEEKHKFSGKNGEKSHKVSFGIPTIAGICTGLLILVYIIIR